MDDQACGDVFAGVDCDERFEEDRTLLGAEQREWLLDTLEESDATWTVIANQRPMAPMDFKEGEKEGFRTEQWDGYVPDQEAVFEAFRNDVDNPVVITGDFHSHWASELPADPTDDSSEPVGAEFVATSISSGGNGADMTDLGRHVIEENENVTYYNDRRGYVRCTLTPEQWVTEHRNVAFVTEPNAPAHTDARFTLQAGQQGLQTPPATLSTDSMAIGNGTTATMDLRARWLDTGLSGGTCTVQLTNPGVARITDATVHDAFGLKEVSISDDGSAVTLRFADIDESVQAVIGGVDVVLGSIEISGRSTGTTDVTIDVQELDDEQGRSLDRRTETSLVTVGPPAVAGNAPTDPDRDSLYEDVNGNGRIDYDDIVTLFEEFEGDSVQLHAKAYDFNQNGRLDYDDIVTLYEEVN
jgi:alkaline phosphatase D